MNLLDRDIIVDIALEGEARAIQFDTVSLKLPKGSPAILINSLRYKDLMQDVVLAKRDPASSRRNTTAC